MSKTISEKGLFPNAKKIEFSQVNSELRFMKGKILTVIDAVIKDEQQNKATKDLIHDYVGVEINKFWRYTTGENVFLATDQRSK